MSSYIFFYHSKMKLPHQLSESSKKSEENVTRTSEESVSGEITDESKSTPINDTEDGKTSDKSETKVGDKNDSKTEGPTEESDQAAGTSAEDEQRREVCPWEDE